MITRARSCDVGAHLGVDQQVEVALAVARLDVGEAVVQVGQRPLARRQQLERVELQRELAAAAADRLALDADDVAER